MREPDWSLYQAFLSVMDAGGLTKASKLTGVSQPTLSRQIMALEQALNVTLFERSGRGLRATPVAITIANDVRRMRNAAHGIRTATGYLAQDNAGTVRITASEIIACYALPSILAKIAQEYPQIQIEVDASNEVANLLELEADIAIRMTKPQQGGLIAKRLPDVRTGFYASRHYVKRAGLPQSLADLLKLRLIGYDRSPLIVTAARRLGIELAREDFMVRSDHQILCWNMVRAGLGVGIIACFVGDNEPDIVRLLPDFSLATMTMWLAASRDVKRAARVRCVYDRLAEHLPLMTMAPQSRHSLTPGLSAQRKNR